MIVDEIKKLLESKGITKDDLKKSFKEDVDVGIYFLKVRIAVFATHVLYYLSLKVDPPLIKVEDHKSMIDLLVLLDALNTISDVAMYAFFIMATLAGFIYFILKIDDVF